MCYLRSTFIFVDHFSKTSLRKKQAIFINYRIHDHTYERLRTWPKRHYEVTSLMLPFMPTKSVYDSIVMITCLNRDPLLCCYVKLIGRLHRHPKTTKLKRTIEQVQQFIDAILYDDVTLFNKDTLTVRWAQICLAYIQKKTGKSLQKTSIQKTITFYCLD